MENSVLRTIPKVIDSGTNFFVIANDKGVWLQSYNVIVACKHFSEKIIDSQYYKYSKTTSKHINAFFGLSSREIEKWIEEGKIKLDNLQNGFS